MLASFSGRTGRPLLAHNVLWLAGMPDNAPVCGPCTRTAKRWLQNSLLAVRPRVNTPPDSKLSYHFTPGVRMLSRRTSGNCSTGAPSSHDACSQAHLTDTSSHFRACLGTGQGKRTRLTCLTCHSLRVVHKAADGRAALLTHKHAQAHKHSQEQGRGSTWASVASRSMSSVLAAFFRLPLPRFPRGLSRILFRRHWGGLCLSAELRAVVACRSLSFS